MLKRVKSILKQKCLTYKDVAAACGVTPQFVAAMLNGYNNISMKHLTNIAKLAGVPVAALFDDYYTPYDGMVECPYCHGRIDIEALKAKSNKENKENGKEA